MTTSTDGTDKKMISQEALLAGACELGILETAWEYFVNKPKYDYWFVIDAPSISSVHALPPHNIAHFGITAFLEAPDRPEQLKGLTRDQKQKHFTEQALNYPLTLGLTEILARYLFERRWSAERPKLMMPSQVASMGAIMDAVSQGSSREISQSFSHTGVDNPLRELRKKLYAARDTSAESFIEDVTNDLEKLLPAIYGAYTEIRQLIRYADVLPFPDRPDEKQATLFANGYWLIADILKAIEHSPDTSVADIEKPGHEISFQTIFGLWKDAIPIRGANNAGAHDDDGTEEENARTLAQIEFLNRQFQQRGMNTRLAFMTTTGRLFKAAMYRYGRIKSGASTPWLRDIGNRDAYNKCQYLRHLLADDKKEDMETMPLFDPRALMTSPDFVNYANREQGTRLEDKSREISAWLPAFFSRHLNDAKDLDVPRLFDTYHHYLLRDTPNRPKYRYIKVEDFKQVQYQELWERWMEYIRIVSAAESSDRIMRREAFHDIRAQILGSTSLRDLMSKKLDEAMCRWLAIVGGNVLQAVVADKPASSRRKQASSQKYRVVPPMILPAFCSDQVSIYSLLYQLQQGGKAFNSSHLSWLTAPEAKQFNLENEAYGREHKVRYIQMLGQAVFFSSLGNWDAAYRLSTQAYVLAEQFLQDEPEKEKPTYVSGREAAYFASITARRLRTSWRTTDRSVMEGHIWVEKYRKAIENEPFIRKCPYRYNLHLVRCDLEGLAWDVFSVLYQCYLNDAYQPDTRTLFRLRGRYQPLFDRLLSDDLGRGDMDDSLNTQHVIREYRLTHTYLKRQIATVALQAELLIDHQPEKEGLNQFLSVLLDTACSQDNEDDHVCLPFSTLEKLVAQTGCKIANRECTISLDDEKEGANFDRWRWDKLLRLMGDVM